MSVTVLYMYRFKEVSGKLPFLETGCSFPERRRDPFRSLGTCRRK